MENRPSIALSATVHQPDERLAEIIQAQLPTLVDRYEALVVRCSPKTHPAILDLLRCHGVTVHVGEDKVESIHNIGGVRKEALRAGLQAGTTHLQLCDFDRLIHWSATYPQELENVIADIANHDLLVLGRTERAWATHPPYQAETEPLFNQVFALVTGLPWDVGAGSRGVSRRAAETLLHYSREQSVGTDAEWPLLLLNRDGFRVGYRACEGLEFETADRFGPEIQAAGSYEAWEAQMSADPHRWVFRIELALLIAEAALRYGDDG
jgi:hypothetical protein